MGRDLTLDPSQQRIERLRRRVLEVELGQRRQAGERIREQPAQGRQVDAAQHRGSDIHFALHLADIQVRQRRFAQADAGGDLFAHGLELLRGGGQQFSQRL